MTQIALDAELIPMKATRINLSMELKETDMSGQSSGTDGSEQGDKGKVLSISGLISFKDTDTLNRLMRLAQQRENGKRKIYRIGNELAKTQKIRQVRFMGRITSDEQENLMAWKVSFQLREYLSVSEVKEQRETAKQGEAKSEGTENSTTVQPTAHAAVTNSEAQPKQTRFEDALLRAEGRLS